MKNQIFDLSYLGIIQCSGIDAEKFLQGQITADIQETQETQATFSAMCDHKGRIISSFYLFKLHAAYLLCLPQNMVALTLTELKKFAIFSKVEINDQSDQYSIKGSFTEDQQHSGAAQTNKAEQYILLPGKIKRYLYLDKNSPEVKHSQTNSLKTWLESELDNEIVMITPEISGIFTPHQLNYQNIYSQHVPTISFKKGCYRGQEIVARMHYLGNLKQHLYLGMLESDWCENGAIIIDDENKEMGHVASCLELSTNSYSILLTLTDNALKKIDKLRLQKAADASRLKLK